MTSQRKPIFKTTNGSANHCNSSEPLSALPMQSVRLSLCALWVGSALARNLYQPRKSDSIQAWNDDDNDDTPLPVVIWHGLGDSATNEGLSDIALLADKVNPGTFVHIVNVNPDDSDDRSASFFGNVSEQLDGVCEQLARHPILSTAPAIDAIGFSQGGQFLRGYVERCNAPRIRNLVTFGSQHSGISQFRACGSSDWLCQGAMALLRFNVWSSFVQSRLVPAQYYRGQVGVDDESYLESSSFLADINNERESKNDDYKKRLASLDNLVLYLFEDDTVSIPKESAWFSEVLEDETVDLRNRTLYKEDWLGLKALDKKGGIKFRSTPGEHMQIGADVLRDVMKEFFGPVKSTSHPEEMEL